MLVLGQKARNGHIVPRCRAPCAGSGSTDGRDRHRQHIRHTIGSGNSADVHVAEVLAGVVVNRGTVGKRRRFQDRDVHHAAIRRSIRGRRTDRIGTRTPDFLELGRRNIGTVISSNRSPELLTASFVDGPKTVSVNDLGLVCHTGVDSETVVRLGRVTRCHGAWLGKEDLVLVATGRGAHRSRSYMRAAAGVAHG